MVYPTKSEPWAGDALGRRADGEFLASFLVKKIAERRRLGLPRTFVLNIDAVCGQGKTYFLTNFQRTLQAVGHPVAYVNAWTDDYADDPLISVMVAIEASLKKHSKLKKTGSSLTEIGAQVVAAGAKGALKQAATNISVRGPRLISAISSAPLPAISRKPRVKKSAKPWARSTTLKARLCSKNFIVRKNRSPSLSKGSAS